MLALLLSSLIAIYLLGPDLVSRSILSFQVPRRNIVQSRGEEVAAAIFIAAVPLAFAAAWAVAGGTLRREGGLADLANVFSGLYSEKFFETNRQTFFSSLHAFAWMNFSLLWRLYLLVVVNGLAFNGLIRNYNRIWNRWRKGRLKAPVDFLLDSIVLPRISEWHVLLSGMRLPPGPFLLVADILTKSNTLYQGRVQDKMLHADGSLHTLTLASPRRFLRDEFRAAAAADPDAETADFWKSIPGNLFVLMGSDIVNLNLKYIRQRPMSLRFDDSETAQGLSRFLDRLEDPHPQEPDSRKKDS